MVDNWFSDFVTLWVVIDPLGTLPIFLLIVQTVGEGKSAKLAMQSVLVAGGVLVAFVVGGQLLLQELEISMSAFQVAGGIVLFLFALTMIFGQGTHNDVGDSAKSNPAIFPLAMPAIANPGAILGVVVLTDNDRYSKPEQVSTVAVLLVVLFLQWLILRFAGRIHRYVGDGGTNIIGRVMGLILASLSVQTIVTGVRGLIHPA